MISIKALQDTINYFKNRTYCYHNNFIIHLHKDDFLFRPEIIGEIIYLHKNHGVKGYVSFDIRLQNGDYTIFTFPLLTDEERTIKDIIE